MLLLLLVQFQMFFNINVWQKITLHPVTPEMKENLHPSASFCQLESKHGRE